MFAGEVLFLFLAAPLFVIPSRSIMAILVFLLALLSAPVASSAAPAAGTPKQVLLIRHADETGQRNNAGLSARRPARPRFRRSFLRACRRLR